MDRGRELADAKGVTTSCQEWPGARKLRPVPHRNTSPSGSQEVTTASLPSAPPMRRILALLLALVLLAGFLLAWYSRDPSTTLLDASGAELTAGAETPGSAVSPFAEIRTLMENGELLAAKEKLLHLLESSDQDGEACILLCDLGRRLDEPDFGTDYGLKATELLPASPAAHIVYAKALGAELAASVKSIAGVFGAIKKVNLFKAELERAIELDPEDTEARTMLVLYFIAAPRPIGDPDRALEVSREIEARDPAAGKRLRAICHQERKELDEAIALCREGIAEFPEDGRFHVTLADIFQEQELFEEALLEYREAREGEEDEAHWRSLYAEARMRVIHELEPARAIELLEEFIAAEPRAEMMPEPAHAWRRKGNALEQLGRTEEARAAYEESLRLKPGLESAAEDLEGLSD